MTKYFTHEASHSCRGRHPRRRLLGLAVIAPALMIMAAPAPAQQQQQPQMPSPWSQPQQAEPATIPTPTQPYQAPATQQQSLTGVNPGDSLHLTQKAWDDPSAHKGRGQAAPGYLELEWRPNKILQLHTREGLITTVNFFPKSEAIVQLITSDPQSFEAVPSPDKHGFALKPVYAGIDGTIIVYGSSGNTYNFYVQSVPYNAPEIQDARVTVTIPNSDNAETAASEKDPAPLHNGKSSGDKLASAHPDDPSAGLTTARADAARPGKDFNAIARTGPGRLRTDLKILVAKAEDSIIAPVAAWRDDKFTYLDFGPRASSMNTWPVAALVVDKIESPVGTRVTGADRSIMVIEAIGDIVLRNGQHVVCIKLEDHFNDPRNPIEDEVYRDRPGLVDAAAPAIGTPAKALKGDQTSLVTGPYPVDKALMLASDIIKGYRGKIRPEQIHIQTPKGKLATRDELRTAPPNRSYIVELDADTPEQARQICKDLRYSRRPCRIH